MRNFIKFRKRLLTPEEEAKMGKGGGAQRKLRPAPFFYLIQRVLMCSRMMPRR